MPDGSALLIIQQPKPPGLADEKAPKSTCSYQQGTRAAHCGKCSHFRWGADSTSTCQIVSGLIDPGMWCAYFSPLKLEAVGERVAKMPGDTKNIASESGAKARPFAGKETPGEERAEKVADAGRKGDTQLAETSPLAQMLLKRMGGSGTKNPKSGLKEYWSDGAGGPGGQGGADSSSSGDGGAAGGAGDSGGGDGPSGGAGGGRGADGDPGGTDTSGGGDKGSGRGSNDTIGGEMGVGGPNPGAAPGHGGGWGGTMGGGGRGSMGGEGISGMDQDGLVGGERVGAKSTIDAPGYGTTVSGLMDQARNAGLFGGTSKPGFAEPGMARGIQDALASMGVMAGEDRFGIGPSVQAALSTVMGFANPIAGMMTSASPLSAAARAMGPATAGVGNVLGAATDAATGGKGSVSGMSSPDAVSAGIDAGVGASGPAGSGGGIVPARATSAAAVAAPSSPSVGESVGTPVGNQGMGRARPNTAQIRSMFAAMGLSGSSMERDALARVAA